MPTFRDKLALGIATGFGSGFLPWAAGSWGALTMAIVCWWLLESSAVLFVLLMVALFFLGVSVVPTADRFFYARGGVEHDNKSIVIDEFVGMMITFLPLFYFEKNILTLGMGFLIFRVFDTLKFGLAKYFDGRHSAWGVMLDDVFAGIHAAVIFTLALWVMYQN